MKVNRLLTKIARKYDSYSPAKLEKIKDIQAKKYLNTFQNSQPTQEQSALILGFINKLGGKLPMPVKRVAVSFYKLVENPLVRNISDNILHNNMTQPLRITQKNKADFRRAVRQSPELNEHLKNIRDNIQNPQVQEFLKPLFEFSAQAIKQEQSKANSLKGKFLRIFDTTPKIIKNLDEVYVNSAKEMSENPVKAMTNFLNQVIKH